MFKSVVESIRRMKIKIRWIGWMDRHPWLLFTAFVCLDMISLCHMHATFVLYMHITTRLGPTIRLIPTIVPILQMDRKI